MRTVGVKLEAETGTYTRDVEAAAKTTRGLKDDVDKLGTSSQTTGRKTTDLGGDFRGTARDAKRLQDEISAVERSLAGLAVEFAAASSASDRLDLTKSIRKQQGELRNLLKVQKLLPTEAEIQPATKSFATSLIHGISGGLQGAASSSLLLTAGGVIGAALAPSIGAGIGAAISGGVGAAGIIGGIALIAKDPAIADYGKRIGQSFTKSITAEAQVFKKPVIDSLNQIEAAAARTAPKIGKIFDNAAPAVRGLTQNVIHAGEAIVDSFVNASGQSAPALKALGSMVENVGGAVADMITTVTRNSKAGASALDDLSLAMVNTVRTTSAIVDVLGKGKSGLDSFDGALDRGRAFLEDHAFTLDLTADGYKKGSRAAELYRQGIIGAAGSTNDYNAYLKPTVSGTNKLAESLSNADRAARGERDAMSALSKELRAQTDPVFGLLNAEDKLQAAQDKATEAIRKHKAGSKEAKAATRELALAALDLQGHVGALGGSFTGKLTPQMYATLKAAGLTDKQIKDVAGQFRQAKSDADKYDGKYQAVTSAPGAYDSDKQLKNAYKRALDFDGTYQAFMKTPGGRDAENQIKKAWDYLKGYDGNWTANIKTRGYSGVANDLRHLLAAQRALKENTSVNEANRELSHFFASGGPVYGPGTGTSDSIPARLSAGEHVWTAAEVAALGGQSAMLALRGAVRSGKRVEFGDETPGFAGGGYINMPFPTDVSKTKIPQMDFGGPSGGQTYKWIEAVVRAAFPGLRVISDLRPGARTLTGNRSYHAIGRAVDYPASKPLAEWINLHYKGRTKELITPWNSLNIWNGRRHTYTGAVYRQHNFAGGNAHDHWAMANGGTIREPIVGVGQSGRTYSFGERGPETVIPGTAAGGGASVVNNVNVTVTAPVGSHPVEIGNQVLKVVGAALAAGGELRVNGAKLL